MHNLSDNTLITPSLLQRFHQEADGAFDALMQLSDGRFVGHTVGPAMDAQRLLFSQDLLRFLHKEMHLDGAWVICHMKPKALTPPMIEVEHAQFMILFLDKDGDVQFCVEWEEGDGELLDFADCLMHGREGWAAFCYTAYSQARYLTKDVLDPRAGDQYRRALGERAPSLIH